VILGVDPGLKGGLILLSMEGKIAGHLCMPLTGKNKSYEVPELDTKKLRDYLEKERTITNIYCELPTSYGMLSNSAFSYGYNFALLSKTLEGYTENVKYVQPHIWSKVLHEGQSKDLKGKAKSKIVFDRLFAGHSFGKIAKASFDGLMDAALIAEYGRRMFCASK